MSRTLRTVATVAGVVALAATGFGAIAGAGAAIAGIGTASSIAAVASAVATVASLGAQATAKKPGLQGNVTNVVIGNNLPIPYAMGRTYIGGNLIHDVGYGPTSNDVKNPFRFQAFVYSGGGPVQEIESFQADFTAISFSNGNAAGYYNDYLYYASQLGACPEPSALPGGVNAVPGWGSGHKLSGYAAGRIIAVFSKEGKRFGSGLAQFGVILKGVKAYDPRLDDTNGGAGTHRALNEATYAYTTNPGLHGPTYALGRWQNGKKAVGIGMLPDQIDWPAWIDFANTCDANGWEVGGAVYEGPGISRWDNLKRICEAGGAEPVFVGAKLSVKFDAPKVALDTIAMDDVVAGEIVIPATKPFKDKRNSLVPFYRSASHKWEYVDSDAVTVASYVTADGELKTGEFKPQLVQNKDQSAELAAYELVNSREQGPILMTLKPRFIEYRIGEAFAVGADLAEETGLPEGSLLVMTGREVDPATAVIQCTFETETTSKHAFALGQTGTEPPIPSLSTGEELDTVIAGNETTTSDITSLINTSSQVGFTVTATDTTATLSNHTRRYADKEVAVTGATVSSLTASTTYWFYYDDADRLGGAVTYVATTDYFTAFPSATNPYRHYAGYIKTAAAGGTSSGGGSLPPGGGGSTPYDEPPNPV